MIVITIVIVNYNIPLVADYIRGDCGSAITPLVYRCVKEYMMCDRKKRCIGCKKVLSIDKFPTYRKKSNPDERAIEHYCKKCRYARESKVTFKRPDVVNLFVERTMYDMNGRDY